MGVHKACMICRNVRLPLSNPDTFTKIYCDRLLCDARLHRALWPCALSQWTLVTRHMNAGVVVCATALERGRITPVARGAAWLPQPSTSTTKTAAARKVGIATVPCTTRLSLVTTVVTGATGTS